MTADAPVSSPEALAPSPRPVRVVRWLVLAVVVLVALRLPGFRLPMDQDSGCYATIGVSWARGALPYRDVWDHKPPGIYLVPLALQGLTGSVTAAGLRACAVAFAVGTLLLIYGIVARLLDRRVALLSAFVYAVSSSGMLVTRETLETEHPMVLGALMAVWLIVLCGQRWRPGLLVLAGVCAGASMTFKPISAPVIGLAFLWLVWQQRASGALVFRALIAAGTMGIGFAVVPGIFAGYFAATGTLDDFVACFRYNFVYRVATEYTTGTAAEERAILLSRIRQIAPEQGWMVLLALGGLVSALRRLREPGVWLLLLWAAGAALGMVAAGRFYAYYFVPMCAALAPLAGWALMDLWTGFRATPAPRWGDARHTLLVLLALGVAALGARTEWATYRALRHPTDTNVILQDMARTIRANTQPGDCIFVWGTRQQVYALADRPAPTRFTYDAPFRHRKSAQEFFGEKVYEEMAEAIRSHQCPYVVVTDPNALDTFPELARLLADEYVVEQEATEAKMKTRLYRRKPTTATPSGEGT